MVVGFVIVRRDVFKTINLAGLSKWRTSNRYSPGGTSTLHSPLASNTAFSGSSRISPPGKTACSTFSPTPGFPARALHSTVTVGFC